MEALFIGIDVGTSGVRAIAINAGGTVAGMQSAPMPPPDQTGAEVLQDPEIWWHALEQVLDELLATIDRRRVRALAIDGTSGTLLVADAAGQPLGPGRLYN